MAQKRPVTTETVYGGPPAVGDTPTVPVGDPVPESLNLTGSEPDKPEKEVAFTSPWGSRFTVSAEAAKEYRDLGYKSAK